MFRFIIIFTLLICGNLSTAQRIQYSDSIQISVLTCTSGTELYSSFGHSAFRIKDYKKPKLDVVYNYGMFNYNAPNFYVNFAKGKLRYFLARTYYSDFKQEYKNDNRGITSQVLHLTNSQKEELATYLEYNAKPENATYSYDFFYNNCATKINDVLQIVFSEGLKATKNSKLKHTFRTLINRSVLFNSWGSIGINTALGSVIDKKASPKEHQFLPDYTAKSIAETTLNNKPLVRQTQTLLLAKKQEITSHQLWNPLFIICIVSAWILIVTFFDYKRQKQSKHIDIIIQLTTGTIGVVLLLLWFATDHTATANNLNILWAFAPNLIIAFLSFKKQPPNWMPFYYLGLAILICIQMICWVFKIQEFAYALLPFFIAITCRYFFLFNSRS